MSTETIGGRPYGGGSPASRQINWHAVYEFVQAYLPDPTLIPGTPDWCALDDTDAAKRRALLWPAIWWCLAEDTRQEAMADASREISSAAMWPVIAQRVAQGRGNAHIPRKDVA